MFFNTGNKKVFKNVCRVSFRRLGIINGVNKPKHPLTIHSNKLFPEEDINRFNSRLPELIQSICDDHIDFKAPMERFATNLSRLMPHKMLIEGLKVLELYKNISNFKSEQQTKTAEILGWCSNIMLLILFINDDVVENNNVRWGKPSYYTWENVGMYAVNDTVLMEHFNYFLLKKFFGTKRWYRDYFDMFIDVALKTAIGQSYENYVYHKGELQLQNMTLQNYKSYAICKGRYSMVQMHLMLSHFAAENYDVDFPEKAGHILDELGLYLVIQLWQVNMDEVVIAGVSGRFPECDNVQQFKKCLLQGIDLVNEEARRWPSGIYGLCDRAGKLNDLSSFDAEFFAVSSKQAKKMSPLSRILLETTYESIVDAGINPAEVKSSSVGVYVGCCTSQNGKFFDEDLDREDGYSLLGEDMSMLANRISYSFDLKGPSFTVDSACSSSLLALEKAYQDIKLDVCEAAIVAGSNLLLDPRISVKFNRLGMLAPDGFARVFDNNVTGFVRSEGIGVVFLQKRQTARRIYATILSVKSNNDGYKSEGITFPSTQSQKELMLKTYNDTKIDPSDVEYVEAHGTGTVVGDVQEVNALADVFCTDRRKEPLLIGSLKSNMGHAEGASGICSIIKAIVAMESGIIPGNLHYKTPNSKITSLLNGTIRIVDINLPYKGGLIAINCFGVGGTNVHALLRPNQKSKLVQPPILIPRLLTASGRTKQAVETMLVELEEHKDDQEFQALINCLNNRNLTGHNYRGFKVVGNDNLDQTVQEWKTSRPVWFIYPGMGSQWSGMAKDLMKLSVFNDSIKQSSQILKPYKIDLENILTKADSNKLNQTIESFVANTAMQMALTDVLTDLNIIPDGIIGHSLGEIGCAYVDGAFSKQQALLTSYFRGVSVTKSGLTSGLMAVVNLTPEECSRRCPDSIKIACYNGQENVTITGPSEDVMEFVHKLRQDKIYGSLVKTPKFAFHSCYVSGAVSMYKKLLEDVIFLPKARTKRWISTSISEVDWNIPLAKTASQEYFVNNLLSPVLFHQATCHIPNDAIVVEISPHAVFRSVFKTKIYISLSSKHHHDNVIFFINSIGKLYVSGAQPRVKKLYPKVSFPVSRGTPMINSMIRWNHSVQWNVPKYTPKDFGFQTKKVTINLNNHEKYLLGHTPHGRIIFPAAGYLVLAWKTLAELKMKDYRHMNVIFKNVVFHRATILQQRKNTTFDIRILEGTSNFEICENSSVVVTGIIVETENETIFEQVSNTESKNVELLMFSEDIYKEFSLRGYEYSGLFQGFVEYDLENSCGKLKLSENWTCLLDTVLQTYIIADVLRTLMVPIKISKLTISPKVLKEITNEHVTVQYIRNLGIVRCPGIEIEGLSCRKSLRPRNPTPILEKYIFIPYDYVWSDCTNDDLNALTVLIQIALENTFTDKPKFCEYNVNKNYQENLKSKIVMIANQQMKCDMVYTVQEFFNEADVSIVPNYTDNLKLDFLKLKPGSFLLIENSLQVKPVVSIPNFETVAIQTTKSKSYVLFRKHSANLVNFEKVIVEINQNNFSWLPNLSDFFKRGDTEPMKVYLVSTDNIPVGLKGLTNCLIKEPRKTQVRAFQISDNAKFSLESKFYVNQLKKDLVHNVLKDNVWGSYRHILLDQSRSFLNVQNAYMDTTVSGNLKTLTWIENSFLSNLSNNLCTIYYASLNFRDVMLATGNLPSDSLPKELLDKDGLIGIEFSGRNQDGRRVMGITNGKGLATTCLPNADLLWDIPENWSLQEAATVPVVYSTCYYALIVRGKLSPGETVLIHAGCGGIGLAAITLALHMKCTVFTTVGNRTKKEFLIRTFPELSENKIGDSRNVGFKKMVLKETNGRGVDLVLNSLSGELFHASLECLKENGRFLELGKTVIINNVSLEMSFFLSNTTFHGIFLDTLLFSEDRSVLEQIHQLVSKGISDCVVKPLHRTVFQLNQVEQAFQYLSTGKNIGKVLVKIRDEEQCKQFLPEIQTTNGLARVYMQSNKSYILVGGLGGMGLELGDWLVKRNAQKLVFTSRTTNRTSYQNWHLNRWRQRGIQLFVCTANLTTHQGVKTLFDQANKLGPIGGIFNLAVVLKGAIFENQTESNFRQVFAPKADLTRRLDEASRNLAPHLDHFVAFSSITCGFGSAGMTNYGMANSAMEQICEARRSAGLPAVAIQWGPVKDVGLYWRTREDYRLNLGGFKPQTIDSCLEVLDVLLKQPNGVVSSLIVEEKCESLNESLNDDMVVDSICRVLGIDDSETVSYTVCLKDLGMDSLMAAEIGHILEEKCGLTYNIKDIRSLKLATIKEFGTKDNFKQFSNLALPKNVIVDMKDNINACTSSLPIFFIHGMEGNTDAFRKLADCIQYHQVYGIQYTSTCNIKSIKELAKFYINQVKTINKNRNHVFVGYSFGACVAIEMGIQLESSGESVKLLLLDGSHIITQYYNTSNTAKLRNKLAFLLQFLDNIDKDHLINNAKESQSITQQLAVIEEFVKNGGYSNSIAGKATLGLLYRTEAGLSYNPTEKFNGPVTLIKASENDKPNISEDYDLHRICNQPVNIVVVEGNHSSILTDDKAVKIICNVLNKLIDY